MARLRVKEKVQAVAKVVTQPLTCSWDDLPEWQRDNQHILTGYRPASGSYWRSFQSLGHLHNESVNIYSHLIPAIVFAVGSAISYRNLYIRYEYASRQDVYVFGCFFLGAVGCLGMSATYHTMSNHSHAVAKFGNKLDYLGIVSLIWGSFVPSIYYGFACEPGLIKTYWAMITTIGAGCALVSVNSTFRQPQWRPFRAAMFAAMGLSAVVPVFHGLQLYGTERMESLIGLRWLVFQGVLYLVGAATYAVNIDNNNMSNYAALRRNIMAERAAQIAGHLNYPKGMLQGQVAIITGSGQGIGGEAARLFANEGAKVIVSDIDAKKAEEVASSIRQSGGQAIAVPGDMLDDNYIKTLVQKAADFGDGKLHVIVNNAGYTWDGVIHKTTDKQWENIVALHGTAPFKLVRAAAPYFRVKDGAPRNIINVSSTSGTHGNAGQANYAFAKAGVTGLTKAIAKEWGPQFGVRVNTVAFGHIQTRLTAAKELGSFVTTPDGQKIALGIPQAQKDGTGHKDIPLGRPGTATEAASAILAIASPLFSYVSGQTIEVTGGRGM
ncbi:hypothetical protein FH972_021887 [Carpinus fangiana]|uniref:3-oxoacyl-[acyl-carrier-protein] reductase n=1 Tax=Carpinus fangiana TaxID=176857 RepID=A0A5N6KR03_9ROSI|nr:hypothetical protein FH972_021887 [Carpinus fangiana]